MNMFLVMVSWFFCYLCFFFFKQKTAYELRISDWSSDVCSSDLPFVGAPQIGRARVAREGRGDGDHLAHLIRPALRGEARHDPAQADAEQRHRFARLLGDGGDAPAPLLAIGADRAQREIWAVPPSESAIAPRAHKHGQA